MNTWRVHLGDVRTVLAGLPAESVQTCVTSPPYFGLRDYGAEGQIGLEPTPDAYVAELVNVFREVRRVLRDDGTVWLNLGDSYANDTKWGGSSGGKHATALHGPSGIGRGKKETGLKPKDLIGIPWRVAFALQADGWYLRSDIIWYKPNPMPESVTDRPTKAHEYLFLLTKSARYYYDAEAVAEPASSAMVEQLQRAYDGQGTKDYGGAGVQNPSDVKRRILAGKSGNSARRPASARGVPVDTDGSTNGAVAGSVPWEGVTRNKRTVWTVTTQPYPEAHFATYPEALIEPCILAGSKVGDLVLDPFTGSGTTGAVAIRHQRSFVGVELNPAYLELARKRIGNVAPMFSQEVA